jgi:hypothetical protein
LLSRALGVDWVIAEATFAIDMRDPGRRLEVAWWRLGIGWTWVVGAGAAVMASTTGAI